MQYRFRGDAAKAIRTVTGRKIGGRPVVVDWALQKGDYTSQQERGGKEDEEDEEGEESGEMGASEKVERALSSIPDGDEESSEGEKEGEEEEGEEVEEEGEEVEEEGEEGQGEGTDSEADADDDVGESASVEAAESRAGTERVRHRWRSHC